MPEAKNAEKAEAAEPIVLEPGFYVEHKNVNSGPYASEDDAVAFNDGHLEGAGKVNEVTAEVND